MPPDEKWIVVFSNYIVREVMACSPRQARILAQAENIKNGEDYIVDFVKDDENRVVLRGMN